MWQQCRWIWKTCFQSPELPVCAESVPHSASALPHLQQWTTARLQRNPLISLLVEGEKDREGEEKKSRLPNTEKWGIFLLYFILLTKFIFFQVYICCLTTTNLSIPWAWAFLTLLTALGGRNGKTLNSKSAWARQQNPISKIQTNKYNINWFFMKTQNGVLAN